MESFGRSWVAICLTILTGFTVEGHSIAKRNVFQLCDLMQYYTGISCVDYLNYGCYCGKGQVAATPRDEVDRCCQIHDNCYGMVDNGDYCWLKSIHVFYWSTCSGTECTCPSWPWTCSQKVCECDRDFAKCLTTAGYNETYADYDRGKHCVD